METQPIIMRMVVGVFSKDALVRIELVENDKMIDHEFLNRRAVDDFSDKENFANKEGTDRIIIADSTMMGENRITEVFNNLAVAFQ